MKHLLLFILLVPTFLFGNPAGLPRWNTSLTEALSQAQQTDRPILLVFSGSDWCRPCMQMDQQVFQTEGFAEFAREHLTLLKADFPRRRKNQPDPAQAEQSAQLAETYNPAGQFPTILLLDPRGKLLQQTGFQPDWMSLREALQTHLP